MYSVYVSLPNASSPTPPEIINESKYYPFLKNCLGALDGTHIHASVPAAARPRYRNRKGFVSQNVLAVVSFDMRFLYILSGWEGSASDSRIFQDARENDLTIPSGRFYLGDAGFPAGPSLLVPYRGVRYHLREWIAASAAKSNDAKYVLKFILQCKQKLTSDKASK